jgi:hypothetical protein
MRETPKEHCVQLPPSPESDGDCRFETRAGGRNWGASRGSPKGDWACRVCEVRRMFRRGVENMCGLESEAFVGWQARDGAFVCEASKEAIGVMKSHIRLLT